MKLNEFLTEIQIQPEAAEKIGTIVSSDRVTQKRISGKQVFVLQGQSFSFIRKYFRRRITGCCFYIISAVWGRKLMRLMKREDLDGTFSGYIL